MQHRYSRLIPRLPTLFKIAARSCYSAEHRRLLAAYFQRSTDLHQPTSTTALNRYPHIFRNVQQSLAKKANVRLLSFGCSTGEEVITLREYFPTASIVGTDINQASLEVCINRGLDGGIQFVPSADARIGALGPYDAIFAMAVLQYLPHLMIRAGIRNIHPLYPFWKFDSQLTVFDSWLKPGGFLALQHTQYRFCDASIAAHYETCGRDDEVGAGVRLYDRHGRLLEATSYADVVFQKRS